MDGFRLELEDMTDLVIVRSHRRGSRHDISPLTRRSRGAGDQLVPLFGFPSAGVGVYAAPVGSSAELSSALNEDPEIQFAGRGLRDRFGAPVVYTENIFVKFSGAVASSHAQEVLREAGLELKRSAQFAEQGYLAGAPAGTGRDVFDMAAGLLDRDDVELCHPELVREVSRRGAFPQQWHLAATEIGGVTVDAHASVTAAWAVTRGEGTTICVIDDGVDIAHE
jgi:hypothetical protein